MGSNESRTEPQLLTVGLIQMSCQEDPEANLRTGLKKIRMAARRGAQIICLPELFRSRYFCQKKDPHYFEMAEPIPGPTTDALGALSRELEVIIIGSIFERTSSTVFYNTAVVMEADGRLQGTYRKVHIPGDPYYQEKFYFASGDLGFSSHPTRHGRIGVLVCWDQWFPEAARLTALQGARFIFCPTAIGWLEHDSDAKHQAECDAWETVQRGHALANGVFWVATNRVGREDRIRFWGQSFVCDPFGRVLARSAADEEDILVVSCDLSRIDSTRQEWPFLEERRTEAYRGLESPPPEIP